MLPFLQPKKMSSTIIAKVKPSGGIESEAKEGEMDPGLLTACEDMISAMHAKNATALAQAFQSAIEMCGYQDEAAENASGEE